MGIDTGATVRWDWAPVLGAYHGAAAIGNRAVPGTPPSLFTDADGTAQREAVRRWPLNLVIPVARILETELRGKLEADVGLKFDSYPLDLAGRAQAFQKMVAAGMDPAKAAGLAGLMDAEN